MKILYGVQGTGNGHITRAIAMTRALSQFNNIHIDVLVSGRSRESIGFAASALTWRRGMTFVTSQGQINIGKTITQNNLPRLLLDVKQLDLSAYDHVLTDYEPVVSWAAKLSGRETIGIGHQYAFSFNVPMRGANPFSRALLRHFAPASRNVGLHWHHFDYPILPPIVDLDVEPDVGQARRVEHNKVVVYLPFEDPDQIVSMLKRCPDYEFYIYHPDFFNRDEDHIHMRTTSRTTFKEDLLSSNAVICNTGFELISECLALGIKILTRPLAGQVEQLANAAALTQLDYATVTDNLFLPSIEQWLTSSKSVQVTYPDVQTCLAAWLAGGAVDPVDRLAEKMWGNVKVLRRP